MGFFNIMVGSIRLWILLYLIFSILAGIFVVIYFFREKIRAKYYKIRWPEKVIKCVIYYPSGVYKVFWRLIPKGDIFEIEKKPYLYNNAEILKNNDIFVKGTDHLYVIIDGKKYNVDSNIKLKEKWSGHWPELHYIQNNPAPINYLDLSNNKPAWSSDLLSAFNENDLFRKLLTMDAQKSMLLIILLLGLANLGVGLFIMAKLMGWLK